jgi:hypothetical protein
MLISGEIYAALKEAGASDDKAEAAAALIAVHERRLLRIETLHAEVLRWGAIVGIGTALALIVALIVALAMR